MWRVTSLSNLIDRGDRIELHDYDAAGTLQGDGASSDGTSVTIDGVSDLRDSRRHRRRSRFGRTTGDTLVLDIDQPGHDHLVKFFNVAHDYFG